MLKYTYRDCPEFGGGTSVCSALSVADDVAHQAEGVVGVGGDGVGAGVIIHDPVLFWKRLLFNLVILLNE